MKIITPLRTKTPWHSSTYAPCVAPSRDWQPSEKPPPMPRAKHAAAPVPTPMPGAGSPDGPAEVVLTGGRLALWSRVRDRYALDAASEALLKNAAEALERAAQLAAQVDRDGTSFRDRFGQQRINPAVLAEASFRGLAERALAKLAARFEGGD